MTKLVKIFEGAFEFSSYPETPLVNSGACDKQAHGPLGTDFDIMRVRSGAETNGTKFQTISFYLNWIENGTAIWKFIFASPRHRNVCVAALQNTRHKPIRVIVKMPLVIAPVPNVQTNREQSQIQNVTVGIRTLSAAQRFFPSELEERELAAGWF